MGLLQHIDCFFSAPDWATTTWVVKIILDPAASSMEIPLGIGFFWFGFIQMTWFAFCVRGLLANLLSVAIFIALFYKPICTKSVFFLSFFWLFFFFFSFFNITSPISAPWKTALFWPPSFVFLFGFCLLLLAGWLAVLVRERIPLP